MTKKNYKSQIRDTAITAGILTLCFGASLLLQDVFEIPEQITTTFAFAVFLISLLTDGYIYGLVAALISVLLVNYAFTFPYFSFNFLIRSNFFSAVVMTIISVLTSALTTKVKHQEAMKVESELERMRANLLRAISHDLRSPLTTIYGSCTPIGASANITGIGILRKEGYEVKNSDFFKIGIPFTLAAIIPAYIYVWLVYGV